MQHLNRGGTVVGPSHAGGGVKFILDTGRMIEEEGREINIPAEVLEDDAIYTFKGNNRQVLDQILAFAGLSITHKVTDVRAGDIVICVRSVEDKTTRTVSGTIEQILHKINTSKGCKPILSAKNGMKIPLKQRIKDWQTENPNSPRWQKKKAKIEELSNGIQRLRMNVSRDVQSEDERTALTALVVGVMDKTAERIGNDDSADNGHFGVTGFRKKHITVIGNTVHLEYVGKSGTKHEKSFSDARIAKAMKKAIKNSKSKFIFETSDGFRIKSDKVNRYLEQFKISAKDMRGYLANKWMVDKLKRAAISPSGGGKGEAKERKKIFNKALKQTAGEVGHGKGTLKKHYLIPELQNEYIENNKIIDMKKLGYYQEGGLILPSNTFVRDTLITTEKFNQLSDEDKKRILELIDEYKNSGYIDVRTQLGPDQAARLSERQREKISSTASRVFRMEDEIKEILKGREQRGKESIEKRKKEIEGKLYQIDNYIKLVDGLGSMAHLPNGKLKLKYQRSIDSENERKKQLLEELESMQMSDGGKIEKAKLKYAKKDIELVTKEGGMSITDTKYGLLHLSHHNGIYIITNNQYNPQTENYEVLFKGNKADAIQFVKNAYTIEGDAPLPKYQMNAEGGTAGESEVYEKDGTKYWSSRFNHKGNDWRVMFVWGKYNHIDVTKLTNNPFGGKFGKEFDSIDEAVDYYKDPIMRTELLLAKSKAESLGYSEIKKEQPKKIANLPKYMLNAEGGKAGDCGCFKTYLQTNKPELCERIVNENINEVPELRAEMDAAHKMWAGGKA